MSIRVYAEGRIFPPEEARISVFNRGFLYGESVFESVGTVRGELFALDEHLDRLARSAGLVGIVMPPRDEIERAVRDTVAAANNAESRVRIILTQGSAASTGDPSRDGHFELQPAADCAPQLTVIAQPLQAPPREAYENGVAVEIVSITRNHPAALDPSVKSGNYLNNVLALREARARRPGVHEAILCSPGGHVAEGATSNIFMVSDGVLQTPAASVGILIGVTRGKVLSLARQAGIACRETKIDPAALRAADEAFITSAARGVLPVTRIDGQPVGDGTPGPITRRLLDLYGRLTRGEERQ